jgi:hypothetical protein
VRAKVKYEKRRDKSGGFHHDRYRENRNRQPAIGPRESDERS